MVEPALDPGAIRFAIVVSVMVITAGVASLPPARDFRVFLGAAILCGAWVIAVGLSKYFNDWTITSSVFVLDIFYIIAFYFISRPPKNANETTIKDRNWAGYVAAALALLVIVNVSHVLANNEFALRPLAAVALAAVGLLLFWGFLRGFGIAMALAFLAALAVISLMAIKYYILTGNILTLTAFFIVIIRAMRGAIKNIAHCGRLIVRLGKSHRQDQK